MENNQEEITPDDLEKLVKFQKSLAQLLSENGKYSNSEWSGMFLAEFVKSCLKDGLSYENFCWVLTKAMALYKVNLEKMQEKNER